LSVLNLVSDFVKCNHNHPIELNLASLISAAFSGFLERRDAMTLHLFCSSNRFHSPPLPPPRATSNKTAKFLCKMRNRICI
jgi:hypothetical protein